MNVCLCRISSCILLFSPVSCFLSSHSRYFPLCHRNNVLTFVLFVFAYQNMNFCVVGMYYYFTRMLLGYSFYFSSYLLHWTLKSILPNNCSKLFGDNQHFNCINLFCPGAWKSCQLCNFWSVYFTRVISFPHKICLYFLNS